MKVMETLRERWRSLAKPSAARRFVAVDFDSRQVRLVQAERAGAGVRILRIMGSPAPEGMDIADPGAVGNLLRAALRENRLVGWPVVMCVPRGMAVLKTLSFPPGTRESELAGMVQYQVEKELPFRPEEAVIDFTTESHFDAGAGLSPEGAVLTRVLVAAVRVPVVDYFRQIALSAGCRLLRLGLRPYANHRCFAAAMASAAGERCAVVHITADETEIDVVAGESLAFSRSVLGKVPARGAGAAEVQEAVAGVVTEIARSLQSYQSVDGGGKVDKVYVCGGTGVEPLVAKELSERLGTPCLLFDPAVGLRLAHRGAGASEFVSALGLAAGNIAPPLDFLHPKRPVRPPNKKVPAALGVVAAALAVIVAVVAARLLFVGAKEARYNGCLSEYRKAEARKKAKNAMSERVTALEAWERKGRNWLDQIARLTALFPPAEEAFTGAITSSEGGYFVFTVHAGGEQIITNFMHRLDQAGYKAKILKQGMTSDSRYPQYPHTADMRITPPAAEDVDLASLKAEHRPQDDLAPGEVQPPRTPRPPQGGGGPGPGPVPRPRPRPSPGGGFSPGPTPSPGGGPPPIWRDPNFRRRGTRGGGGG